MKFRHLLGLLLVFFIPIFPLMSSFAEKSEEVEFKEQELARSLGLEIQGMSKQDAYLKLEEELLRLVTQIKRLRLSLTTRENVSDEFSTVSSHGPSADADATEDFDQTPNTILQTDGDESTNNPQATESAPNENSDRQTKAPAEFEMTPERIVILFLIIFLILLVGGICGYFLILQPRRKRRPMLEAFAIIENDEHARFHDAEGLLNKALTSGLKRDEVDDVRFALAYVRARTQKYADALSNADELCAAAAKKDRNSHYLRFWLLAQLKDDKKIEEAYSGTSDLLGDYLDSKLIAGITFLRMAKKLWARHDVEEAIRYFELLQPLKLEELKKDIPKQIDDHQIVFGIMALYENDLEKAKHHFTNAGKLAEKSNKSKVIPEIGLLICEWKREDHPDIDDRLSDIISQLDKIPTQDALLREDRDEGNLLNRNVYLWHSIALLFKWLRRPSGSKIEDEQWALLENRLQKVSHADPEMGDPHLIYGLMRYYFFFENSSLRNDATDRLKKACKLDVNVPEILTIIDREDKLAEIHRQGLAHYMTEVRKWLKSSDVPKELRQELIDRLKSHERFKELGEIELTADEEYAPSIADIQFRVSTLGRRVNNIVKPRLAKDSDNNGEKVENIMNELQSVSEVLSENTQKLEKTEQEMMLITGEFLLSEEDENSSESFLEEIEA